MKIAFLGLGSMGQPMAQNLLKAGYEVKVWNRSAAAVEPLVANGASSCKTPADIAECEMVISMLADDHITHDVMVTQGALSALDKNAVYINMATVSNDLTREMTAYCAERGLHYIAAPVLGRVDVAAAGNLNILAAGEPEQLARAQPLFDVLGQKTWHFGDNPEQASTVKLAANFMLATVIESVGESAALVKAHGIEPKNFIDMLTSTLFSAPVYKNYGGMIAEERYTPAGFKLTLGLKDVRLAQQAAEEKNVPMPFASVLRDNFIDAIAQGDGNLDWSALANVSARRSGLK
ncbi:NAD(P)-dependent oxidoreductase [Hafnia paralvei]|jgi:3-hydroxyisobutyrate dehydrogenase-like beta-hydroxyacid dehydrogenase|uniref:NAD(P)-dependent oxidoreductase n=1 Tax=Hafnia paralvei TaxID=546367 RepID=UPI001584E771|nr:NAD(P)-dependent oxidoreductase [Hafnia paralvei]MCE9881926.1 NAD(P)-dependent oxidoreductase [Hafnia paralvei]MCE9906007.1 NAD(P)-dependent oxidoreductase [Hafnia paralvei]MCE9913991.1 NAD(P)-dependent oxidoreductase [Hafnia paralvei]NUN42995.1 NAD(P)-dependent oxidoreductase [Hafnia paralvei]